MAVKKNLLTKKISENFVGLRKMSIFAETALQIAAMCFYYLAGFATFMSGAFFVWI